MNAWPLLGIGVVVLGFVLRFNPLLVVIVAALTSGLLAKIDLPDLLALIGNGFVQNRALMMFLLTLPAIGLLEHYGLRERAQAWIVRFRRLTLARFQIAYLGLRQLISMVGLTHVAGPAQTVRPLVAPMSEAAAERDLGPLQPHEREQIRAHAAATDNIGLFFGEDVFVAIGAVLLIQGFYARNGIVLEPLHIALWALPTAVAAFAVQALRLLRMERRLRQARVAERATTDGTPPC